ncbi:hypothetical protein RYH80_11050 [Halobaculum sp. MBLA0147]|uniref:hypothetical protein n=1 Tax=Halobaculum sp. MBLA0147 TaxID=3079934 RepID=UPI003524C4E8
MPRSGGETRRDVLQSIGAAAAGTTALGAVGAREASADPETRRALIDEYRDGDRLASVFAGCSEVVETLVGEGVLSEEFTLADEDFSLDSGVGSIDLTEDRSGTQLTAVTVKGDLTAVAVHTVRTDDYVVDLYAQPERERSYARVTDVDTGELRVVCDGTLLEQSTTCDDYSVCDSEVCDVEYTPGGPSNTYVEVHYDATEDSDGGCEYTFSNDSCTCSSF